MKRIGDKVELNQPLKLITPLALAVYKDTYDDCLIQTDNGVSVDVGCCEKMMLAAIYEMLLDLTGARTPTDDSSNDGSNATEYGNNNGGDT